MTSKEFDNLPQEERERIWQEAKEKAASCSNN